MFWLGKHSEIWPHPCNLKWNSPEFNHLALHNWDFCEFQEVIEPLRCRLMPTQNVLHNAKYICALNRRFATTYLLQYEGLSVEKDVLVPPVALSTIRELSFHVCKYNSSSTCPPKGEGDSLGGLGTYKYQTTTWVFQPDIQNQILNSQVNKWKRYLTRCYGELADKETHLGFASRLILLLH